MRNKLSIFLILLFISINTYSQYISIKGGSGKIIPSYSGMPKVNPSYFTAIEFGTKTYGFSEWEKLLNYPEYGLEVLYGYLNNDYMGDVFGIQPYLKIPIVKKKSFYLNAVGALGFAYFTKKYDFFDNPENGLIGSHITNYTRLELEIGYSFKNYKLFADLGVFHFSNGHVNLPNIGANIPQAKIGASYSYGGFKDPKEMYFQELDTSFNHDLSFALGRHSYGSTMTPPTGPVFTVYTVSYSLTKNINEAYRISIGTNFSWYSSYYNFLQSEIKLNSKESFRNSSASAIFLGQEIMMGKVGLYGQFGIDIYKPFIRNYGDIFDEEKGFSKFAKSYNSNRLGLKYYLKRINQDSYNMSIGMFIKANYAQADFAEVSLSIII